MWLAAVEGLEQWLTAFLLSLYHTYHARCPRRGHTVGWCSVVARVLTYCDDKVENAAAERPQH